MLQSIDIEMNVRGYLHLLEEQGMDISAFMKTYNELSESLAPAERMNDSAWCQLERDVFLAASGWETDEPSTLDEIKKRRPAERTDAYDSVPDDSVLRDRAAGGWFGRIAGCIQGKPVECCMKETDSRGKLRSLLDNAGEYPLDGFITLEIIEPYWKEMWAEKGMPTWFKEGRGRDSLRGHITFAPADDDLNYTVLSMKILDQYGPDFTPDNVLSAWTSNLSYSAVCTAEKAAYRNKVMGMSYPETAAFMNPMGEWIGAQIRTDAYGYVMPGKPGRAAELAWNDAACSHYKNGIYGAMWVSAAIAAAYIESDPETVILRGLEQVPEECRFTEHMKLTLDACRAHGDDFEKTFDDIEKRLGFYHCVHTVNNACVVAAALMHGGDDFGKVISIAVMGGLDTDCNGATAGSIAGVMLGKGNIDSRWTDVFNDTLHTSISGRNVVKISDLVSETVEFINKFK